MERRAALPGQRQEGKPPPPPPHPRGLFVCLSPREGRRPLSTAVRPQVDGVKRCCLVRFEDNSEFWVLRKDIHSFAAGVEEVCCICDAPPLKEPLVNCLKCRHGYHAECHTPSIEPEADSDSWICRQCVFAVATKRGGAIKRGRFARLMHFMKLRLPYQLTSLDWDAQHLSNQQQCYCYCAGPGEWNLKMLQCGSCGQWFHEACTQCLSKPLLYGDRFYQFQCSVCNKGPETVKRLPMTWVDLAHLVLYHLSLCCKRKYFDFDHEILSFTNENWDSLLLGALSDTPRQERCHNLLNALNAHKERFVSGKEIKKKKCLFGLQVRAPPPLTSDSLPLITEPPVNISHRRSPLSPPCQRRSSGPEARKSKRRITETQHGRRLQTPPALLPVPPGLQRPPPAGTEAAGTHPATRSAASPPGGCRRGRRGPGGAGRRDACQELGRGRGGENPGQAGHAGREGAIPCGVGQRGLVLTSTRGLFCTCREETPALS
ncbi:PHD finger protein 1 isoform X4 [Syngnathoides biaculeatus]|uniref:PHD finger protein 1 isoform X4 n=1 Tax=Syngnathoides biaculeatus TaxID=300417 RepID=UPI002ADDED9A|nr:PHD finger protein 1 isoform X4 [Syngnathoides biaculeatus]